MRHIEIKIQWLIGTLLLWMMFPNLPGVSMAQSTQSPEPLPRTFKGVPILMLPPIELQKIRLLMTPAEVKAILKKARFKFEEDEGQVAGVDYLALHVRQPQKGFQLFSFHFRDGELYNIRIEYDMRYFSLDFPAYFAELKAKYNEPAEVKDLTKNLPTPLATIKVTIYRWADVQTELSLQFSPPGKDPLFGRPDKGNLVWSIADKQLAQKNREDLAKLKERQKR